MIHPSTCCQQNPLCQHSMCLQVEGEDGIISVPLQARRPAPVLSLPPHIAVGDVIVGNAQVGPLSCCRFYRGLPAICAVNVSVGDLPATCSLALNMPRSRMYAAGCTYAACSWTWRQRHVTSCPEVHCICSFPKGPNAAALWAMQVLSLECRNDGGPGHFQLVATMPQEGQPLEQVSLEHHQLPSPMSGFC